MIREAHWSIDALMLQTHNYKTSMPAHDLLEKIIKRKCEEVTTIDYGFRSFPD